MNKDALLEDEKKDKIIEQVMQETYFMCGIW